MMLDVVKRQSAGSPSVDRDREKIEHLAKRLREVLLDRGHVDARGGPSAQWLADAAGVRWATASEWLKGTLNELPHTANLEAVARGLDMTLDELLGLAIGEEPTSQAWRDFLETPEGRSMDVEERRWVGSRTPRPGKSADVMFYKLQLLSART
jgi:hypothetical protein